MLKQRTSAKCCKSRESGAAESHHCKDTARTETISQTAANYAGVSLN